MVRPRSCRLRNVVLTTHHETLIETLVSSGRYQNASEVLREGLRLIEAHEAREAAKLKALQEAAQAGFAELDQGRYHELQDEELEGVRRRPWASRRVTGSCCRPVIVPIYRLSAAAEADIIGASARNCRLQATEG